LAYWLHVLLLQPLLKCFSTIKNRQMGKHTPLLFIIFSTLFASIAQIIWKFAANSLPTLAQLSLSNLTLLTAGFILYSIAALFMIFALRSGELSIIYPIMATSYVWVSLLSPLFFPDFLNVWKIVGVSLILFSVALLGLGSKREVSPHG
jgi:multidrug transporter EmrE-like cation transporter